MGDAASRGLRRRSRRWLADQHYDVIVIGTGAGGGTLAHRLAPTGKRILILERGDYLPRERDNWDSTAVFVRGKYRAPEFWYDAHGHEFPPEVNYYVGGNTKFYGAALFRLRPEDFGEIQHHGGLSPAWPIGYADLEPFYTQAEHLYRVHGRHGEDPTEGRPARSTRTRRSSTSRASSSSATTWRSRACTRSTCRSVSTSRRTPTGGPPEQRLHPVRPGRRLPLPGRREVRRAGDLRRPGAGARATSRW